MIESNQFVTDLISGNWLAIAMFMAALKVLAKATKWAGDDTIYTMFSEMLGAAGKTLTSNKEEDKHENSTS